MKDTRQVRALAKESLFRKPILGNAMRNMGHIPVHRGGASAKDSLGTAVLKIKEGELIGIYPEGTVPPHHRRAWPIQERSGSSSA